MFKININISNKFFLSLFLFYSSNTILMSNNVSNDNLEQKIIKDNPDSHQTQYISQDLIPDEVFLETFKEPKIFTLQVLQKPMTYVFFAINNILYMNILINIILSTKNQNQDQNQLTKKYFIGFVITILLHMCLNNILYFYIIYFNYKYIWQICNNILLFIIVCLILLFLSKKNEILLHCIYPKVVLINTAITLLVNNIIIGTSNEEEIWKIDFKKFVKDLSGNHDISKEDFFF